MLSVALWLIAASTAAAHDGVGPVEVAFPGGTLRPGLSLQTELRMQSENDWALRPRVRRLRFRLDGDVLDEHVRFGVQVNASPGSLELVDAWVDGRLPGDAWLRGGVFRVPFSRYGDTSSSRQAMVDTGLPVRTFGAERQLGLMLRRGGRSGFAWRAAVTTGSPTRPSAATGLADLYGESVPSWGALADGGGSLPVHPEVIGRIEWNSEGLDPARVADFDRGPLRVHTSLSAAWDLEPTPAQDLSARVAPEVMVKSRGMSADLVGYLGFADTAEGAGTVVGGMLEGTWAPVPRWELAARAGVVSPGERVVEDAGSDPRTQVEVAAGGTHYFAADNLKLQLEGSWLRDPGHIDENLYQLRLQLQLAIP